MSIDPNINVGFPFELDNRGYINSPDHETHIRQLMELVLFTSPGERVNRPDFGCGLLELLFADAADPESVVSAYEIEGQLSRWLGEYVDIESLDLVPIDSMLQIRITYRLKQDDQLRVAVFERRDQLWSSG